MQKIKIKSATKKYINLKAALMDVLILNELAILVKVSHIFVTVRILSHVVTVM